MAPSAEHFEGEADSSEAIAADTGPVDAGNYSRSWASVKTSVAIGLAPSREQGSVWQWFAGRWINPAST